MARHMEPTAVTSQETMDNAPTCASFDGSMMMPEPIMLTAVRMVSWKTLILFALLMIFSFYEREGRGKVPAATGGWGP